MLIAKNPDWVKDTIKYEVAQAERLTAADVGRASARQARMYQQIADFFARVNTSSYPSPRFPRLMSRRNIRQTLPSSSAA